LGARPPRLSKHPRPRIHRRSIPSSSFAHLWPRAYRPMRLLPHPRNQLQRRCKVPPRTPYRWQAPQCRQRAICTLHLPTEKNPPLERPVGDSCDRTVRHRPSGRPSPSLGQQRRLGQARPCPAGHPPLSGPAGRGLLIPICALLLRPEARLGRDFARDRDHDQGALQVRPVKVHRLGHRQKTPSRFPSYFRLHRSPESRGAAARRLRRRGTSGPAKTSGILSAQHRNIATSMPAPPVTTRGTWATPLPATVHSSALSVRLMIILQKKLRR
jgi:hypothetical protein